MEEVLQEFRAVPLCLMQRGNAARNTINMLNDFYFKVFHPVHHYTLEVSVCSDLGGGGLHMWLHAFRSPGG